MQSVLPLMLETRVVLTARTPTPSRARLPPRPAVRWLGCRLSPRNSQYGGHNLGGAAGEKGVNGDQPYNPHLALNFIITF